jgi:hypothetical protein
MTEYVILGFIGGLIVDFLQVLELQNKPKGERPDHKEFVNWLPYVAWPVLGAILVYVYDSPDLKLNKLLSLQIGVSAPLIIRQMTKSNPFQKKTIELDDQQQ